VDTPGRTACVRKAHQNSKICPFLTGGSKTAPHEQESAPYEQESIAFQTKK